MKKILLDSLPLTLIKNSRARSIRLRLNPKGEMILVIPFLCSEKRALEFAKQNKEWIQEQLKGKPDIFHFKNKDTISFLGQSLIIKHDPSQKRGVYIEGGFLIVSGEEAFLHRRVRDFIKKEMYLYVQQKSQELAAIIHQKPKKITLRDTSSRWGSCSSQKDLNFCWKLALAPLFVLDYIIAHEVAHLQEMNHGPRFWSTVALINHDQAEAQIWLRKNGRKLQSIQ